MKVIIFFVSLAFLLSSSNAFPSDDYKCSVIDAVSLDINGSLKESSWAQHFKGQEFVVERVSGRIIGGKGISNHNGTHGQPKVIDSGSAEQSYKVMTVYSPFTSVNYLEIKEFEKGSKKPFIFITSGDVLTGICLHY